MPGANELSTSIRIALRAVLPLGVQVDIEPDSTKAVPTFNVFIRAGGGLHRFLAGWAGEGWPADVERLIAAAPQIEIVFGKRISQGAKEWLLTRHLGWVDESGDANVNLGTGLIILRGGRERLLYEERTVRWTQTMIAAAEAVFVGVPPTVEAVEQATGISRGASNNALLAETVGGNVVDRGHLLEVRALPTRLSAKGPVIQGIQVALLARVYADLLAVGGRFSEAARYLRDHADVGSHS